MSIFKACDVRGVYPDELDEEVARAVGCAVGSELGAVTACWAETCDPAPAR